MERKHFAVFSQLGNGHVYPVLPLCSELAKRGHRVTYATNSHYRELISSTGAEPFVFENRPMPREMKEEMQLGLSLPLDDPRLDRVFRSWRAHFFAETDELLPGFEAFYRENPPDLILYDRANIPGRILANRLSVPIAQMSAHFAFYNNLAVRRQGVCENPAAIIEWSKDLDAFLASHGLTSEGSYWHVEDLNIHFFPREFQHHSNSFDARFCFTGALLDRPFRPMWTRGSTSDPVILISGMSLWSHTKIDYSSYFDTLIDALANEPYHCILSIGDDDFDRALPANFELNRRASHLEILPHASLSICHGGMTSTLEAIYNGVPVIMIPLYEGCEEVAYRAAELGCGIRLASDRLSVDHIRDTVRSTLENGPLLRKTREMQELFRRSGGAPLAADRIEEYLTARRN